LRDEVGAIAVPSLVVGSPGDEATPLEAARWLHRHIPGSKLVVIDDAGHLSNLEQPKRFSAAVTAFWERVTGAGHT
jgi:pimeloyl-ACP methyl ester carboxylesterase